MKVHGSSSEGSTRHSKSEGPTRASPSALAEEGRDTELVTVLRRLSDRVEKEMLGGELRPIAVAVAVPPLLDVQGTDGDDATELVARRYPVGS